MPGLDGIYAGLKLVTGPASEVLSLAQAESYLRVSSDGGPVDADVTLMITQARQRCESILKRAFLTQTWQLSLKNWPGRDYQNWPQGVRNGLDEYYTYNYIPLPFAPLQSVTSVTYLDTTATQYQMAQSNTGSSLSGSYNVDLNFEPGRIVLPFSYTWPTAILLPGAPIQIVYVVGYPNIAAWQASFEGWADVTRAMLIAISYAFTNKIPMDAVDPGLEYLLDQLLGPYRIY